MPQTLDEWVKRDQIDTGVREGITISEREQLKALERENKEILTKHAQSDEGRDSGNGSQVHQVVGTDGWISHLPPLLQFQAKFPWA